LTTNGRHRKGIRSQRTRMEVKMALRDKSPAQLIADGWEALNAPSVRSLIVALAFLVLAIPSRGEEARIPGSSQPPDTTQYQRPAIPMDLSVARQKRPTVRAPSNAPNVSPLGNPTLLKLIDVNASAPGSDSVSRTEPSIAVNPEPRTSLWCMVVLATGLGRNALRFLLRPTTGLVGLVYVRSIRRQIYP
jgi:hypothetical protein